MVVCGVRARMAAMVAAKCWAPPSSRSSRSTEVMTMCVRPSSATAKATFSGSFGSRACGSPVRTLQKAQARVQVSPMIIMVAWCPAQHSAMLGQHASSLRVLSRCRRRIWRVSANAPELAGTLTLIQSGLRSVGVSGLAAFSGCRGWRLSRMVTMWRLKAGVERTRQRGGRPRVLTLCGRVDRLSRSQINARGPSGHLEHDAATDTAGQDLRSKSLHLAQRPGGGDGAELVPVEIPRQPPPSLTPQCRRRHHRIDAGKGNAAQDEGGHGAGEVHALRQA